METELLLPRPAFAITDEALEPDCVLKRSPFSTCIYIYTHVYMYTHYTLYTCTRTHSCMCTCMHSHTSYVGP